MTTVLQAIGVLRTDADKNIIATTRDFGSKFPESCGNCDKTNERKIAKESGVVVTTSKGNGRSELTFVKCSGIVTSIRMDEVEWRDKVLGVTTDDEKHPTDVRLERTENTASRDIDRM